MKKSLKTKVVAAIVLTITGFWLVSGIVARKQAASFFAEQESRIRERGTSGKVLADLQQDKRSLFRELASIRFLAATLAIITLSVALGLIWRRRVSRPMVLLSDRIHKMSLGTWDQPIPVEQDDEVGSLVREFNRLGPELSFTAHQFSAASRLAAMALVGQRVVRRTMSARQHLLAVAEALGRLPADEKSREIAIEQARLIAGELEAVAADFDSEFQAELTRVGSTPGTTGGLSPA